MPQGDIPTVRQAFIGAGANLGDRAATLNGAVARLRSAEGVQWVECSGWYETDPVGVTSQPRFINFVVGIETALSPDALLTLLQRIEVEFGRVRAVRWGPRTLDLDLLAYEGETRDTPTLQLPHPRMGERAFVLVPLRELLAREAFRSDRWKALRREVSIAPVDATGVRRWTE